MAFNDQAKTMGSQGPRRSIFKDGVAYKHMSGKSPITFRIQPAFNPAVADPMMSWLPCVDQQGNLTDWGTIIKMVRFVGHGSGGAMKRDLLSLRTFDSPGSPTWCPLEALYRAIMSDPQTWGYLVDGTPDPANPKSRGKDAAFGRISSFLLCNILDVMGNPPANALGLFTQSASSKLIDSRDGLVYTPNGTAGIEEAVARNYMAAYANGDITSPHDAPLLILSKLENKGEFSGYTVSLAVDAQRRVIRRPIDTAVMSQRYNLAHPEQFLNVPTEAELVAALVELLNGRSPHGYHEHALLKATFPTHQIPEPPMAPCATSTVAPGFQPQQPQQPQPQHHSFQQTLPQPQYGQVPQQGQVPGQVPQQGYVPQGIPGQVPQQGYVPQGIPGQAPQPTIPGLPQIPGQVPQQGYTPPSPVQQVGTGPVAPIPGDPVGFSDADFLANLRNQKA